MTRPQKPLAEQNVQDGAVTITCAGCDRAVATRPTAAGQLRLPRGWKRHADAAWCDRCWRARYVLRAVTIPVAGPVDAEWSALRPALQAAWQNTTTVANWAVRELLQADAVRTPALERLPAMPRVYLYPGARAVAPELATASVTSLLRAVEARYRARRYHVIWLRREAPPTYRYPVPYPVHNRMWQVARTDEGVVTVSVPIGDTRWTLRLRGGPRYARQFAAVRQLIDGAALKGELTLYERDRELVCKMVLWLPRPQTPAARRTGGVLYVRTGGDRLWTYHVDQEEPRVLNADQVCRWIASYDRRRQRLAEDTKAEKRPTRRRGRGLEEIRAAWGRKQRARLDSWAHEATAMLAGYAARRGVATVVYDDRDRSYLPHAPWALLRERLGYKLDAVGITLELASGEVVTEEPPSLDDAD